ncbi:hypothetical protein [Actinomadura gamaensis]|uniref:Secreted protein n=1 Tax=Actinomadura gamaensis TaxID=1763541 RepID=A0ABV9U6X7_9ACTN
MRRKLTLAAAIAAAAAALTAWPGAATAAKVHPHVCARVGAFDDEDGVMVIGRGCEPELHGHERLVVISQKGSSHHDYRCEAALGSGSRIEAHHCTHRAR